MVTDLKGGNWYKYPYSGHSLSLSEKNQAKWQDPDYILASFQITPFWTAGKGTGKVM